MWFRLKTIRRETEKWKPIVGALNLKVD